LNLGEKYSSTFKVSSTFKDAWEPWIIKKWHVWCVCVVFGTLYRKNTAAEVRADKEFG